VKASLDQLDSFELFKISGKAKKVRKKIKEGSFIPLWEKNKTLPTDPNVNTLFRAAGQRA
jgi:hypothetical protein